MTPPVICQIPGIYGSASVIVPSLPIGWAWRRAERSLLLQTLSAVYRAVCTGEKYNHRVKTLCLGLIVL